MTVTDRQTDRQVDRQVGALANPFVAPESSTTGGGPELANTSSSLTVTGGGTTVTGVNEISFGGASVAVGGLSSTAVVTVGPAIVTLTGQTGGTPQPLSTILGRTWHVDDFQAAGDGQTDDTAAFNLAFATIGAAGGGRLSIHPKKVYYCVSITDTQLAIPAGCNNVWLDCERTLGGASTTVSPPGAAIPEISGGVIILPSGIQEQGAGANGNYMNPERTTQAFSMAGDNCKVSNIVFVAAAFWNTKTPTWSTPADVCSMEQAVFGQADTLYKGMANNGNGVQLDGAWGAVENCLFYGFNFGVAHVPSLITQNAVTTPPPYIYANKAPGSPSVRNVAGDCWTLLRFGTTGSSVHSTREIAGLPLLAPSGVPTMPYVATQTNPTGFSIQAPADDGNGGTYFVISKVNGANLTWTSNGSGGFSNPYIGTPVAGQTITFSLYDGSGMPVCHTLYKNGSTNRFVGTWQLYSKFSPPATGFVIELANNPHGGQYWVNWGLLSASGSVQLGPTQNLATPMSIAFSALTRRGPGIFLNQVNARAFSDIYLLNNGLCMAGCQDITISTFTGDGSGADVYVNSDIFYTNPNSTDPITFPAEAFFYLDPNCQAFTANAGHIVSWAAALSNNATLTPGCAINMLGVHIGSSPVAIYQNGNPLNVVGCFIGSPSLGVGPASLNAGITATTFPTVTQDGNTLTVLASSNTSLWIDPSCTNIPASALGTSVVALLNASVMYLPTSPSGSVPPQAYIQSLMIGTTNYEFLAFG